MSKIKTDEGTLVHLMIIAFAVYLSLGLILLRVSGWGQNNETNYIELNNATDSICTHFKNTVE